MHGRRGNDEEHVQIRGVPFDETRSAARSRVRVFELAILLSSLRDSCRLGVRKKEREGRAREKKLPLQEAGTRNDNRAATKWPRVVTRVFRLSAKEVTQA